MRMEKGQEVVGAMGRPNQVLACGVSSQDPGGQEALGRFIGALRWAWSAWQSRLGLSTVAAEGQVAWNEPAERR